MNDKGEKTVPVSLQDGRVTELLRDSVEDLWGHWMGYNTVKRGGTSEDNFEHADDIVHHSYTLQRRALLHAMH